MKEVWQIWNILYNNFAIKSLCRVEIRTHVNSRESIPRRDISGFNCLKLVTGMQLMVGIMLARTRRNKLIACGQA